MAKSILRLRSVRKSYGDGGDARVEILHGIDIDLHQREFVALIGPSGSGKSTLLHIMGLLETPTSGSVELLGQRTTTLADDDLTKMRGRHIGFIFQFHHLLPAFSALENVIMPQLVDRGVQTPAMRTRAEHLLERVGLHEKRHHRPTALSGGQQQRVAIARALAMSPALVLADEPTGNLDTQSGDKVFNVMREFNRDSDTTFLIVTHDPRIARRCDRVIRIVDGEIVDGD